ncbi:MAG TPA: hypothetical protein VFB75_13380, partial [Burkholderiales bacterium]|nr:hypothetical protein [Burkholderiales bacterium]
LGALSGLLAAAGASAMGYGVATYVLNLPYTFAWMIWLAGVLAGTIGITAAGYLGTRAVLNVAPLQALRENA